MKSHAINKLADMIQYQKESIVSKVLLKKITGNITLFAFDKKQELSEHTASFDAFVYVIDGKVDIVLNGKSNELSSGESITMPANIPHAVKAIEKFKMMLVMIKS